MAASFSELVKAAKAAKAERIESPDAKALNGGAGEPFRPSTLMPAALQALAQPLPHLSIDKVYDRYEQMKAAKNDAASKQGAAPNGSSAGLPTNPAKTATKKDVATDKPARTSTIPEAIRNLQSAPSAPAQLDQPLPPPAQTKRFDFNSKANADRHSRSMGTHVPDFAPPVGLEDSTQSNGAKGWAAGVAPPRGVKPSAGMICGMPSSAFDGWPEAVPPGSHYEEWVWNLMDREGYTTVELYVDEVFTKQAGILGQAYGLAPLGRPKFNPGLHVLIQVPNFSNSPWGGASRVLLTPMTVRPEAQKTQKKGQGFGTENRLGSAPSDVPPKPVWIPDPAGISAWLNQEVHHNVIFGQAMLDAEKQGAHHMYWVVLSHKDVLEHHQALSNEDKRFLSKFGLEGLHSVQSIYDEQTQRRRSYIVDPALADPVPPAQRYLGHWSGDEVKRAIHFAMRRSGPVIPGWPKEDLRRIRETHAGISQWVSKKAQQDKATSISRPAPVKDIPQRPDANKPKAVNMRPMRRFF